MINQTPAKILEELQVQLKKIIDDFEKGKLKKKEAADKILEVREAIDQVILKLLDGNK
jgi:exonuclease VII small subunit